MPPLSSTRGQSPVLAAHMSMSLDVAPLRSSAVCSAFRGWSASLPRWTHAPYLFSLLAFSLVRNVKRLKFVSSFEKQAIYLLAGSKEIVAFYVPNCVTIPQMKLYPFSQILASLGTALKRLVRAYPEPDRSMT